MWDGYHVSEVGPTRREARDIVAADKSESVPPTHLRRASNSYKNLRAFSSDEVRGVYKNALELLEVVPSTPIICFLHLWVFLRAYLFFKIFGRPWCSLVALESNLPVYHCGENGEWSVNAEIVCRCSENQFTSFQDGESGWSSLHRAMHFGHLAIACVLLQFDASLTLEDSKSRTPVDLLSGPVLQTVGRTTIQVLATEVFSWGSGVNYQLGTGNAHIQKLPCKVDSLHGSFIKLISAAKFHSVAVSARGEVYTWGFGRGGRLGHPDFDIHSGQAAVITPRQVTSGLGARRVKAIAAAKHHTIVATESGEVFTWGSNRGQLGYTSVDTQPTPRRVSSLKARIVAVAAANKHTAGGGVLEGKIFYCSSAAKYHTIVLGSDGEVFTWGHRLVTPRRVVIARNIRKVGNTVLKFHRKERLNVTSIAAGMTHSIALTDDGALFYWASSDPDLRCHQLYSLCGRSRNLLGSRLLQLLQLAILYVGCIAENSQNLKAQDELDELREGFMFDDVESEDVPNMQNDEIGNPSLPGVRSFSGIRSVPSLKSLCEKTAAEHLVEPRNVIQLLEIADALGADDLKKHCQCIVFSSNSLIRRPYYLKETLIDVLFFLLLPSWLEIAIRNLDYILTVSAHDFAGTSLDILVDLEKQLDLKSSEPWSYRRLPTPTATFPAIINSEEEDGDTELLRMRDDGTKTPTSRKEGVQRLDGFLQSGDAAMEGQIAKLQKRSVLESSLAELGAPIETVQSKSSASVDEKWNITKGFVDAEVTEDTNKGKAPEFESSMAIQETRVSPSYNKKAIADIPQNKIATPTTSKKKNRKGGLSMFLSGALDDVPKTTAPPLVVAKSEGPAWGGANISRGLTSLRDIQDEQSKTKGTKPTERKNWKIFLKGLLVANSR
ncbi:UNVERIFIED_CONTAM: Inhibitor of Bruton tyrosine kinase [Sesamum calycinum]|uniref:Inhibitor of Bruton tyrosine kinase n=1 Tax=Sesamum calycinum TaxID=2727403 RepID=A0AAW2NTN4_9LAMI